jgi:branched-chain amino acid transport system permease protein
MLINIIISGLAIGCVYSLIALSISMIYRSSGVTNFAQGEYVMLGSLIGYTLVSSLKINFFLGILIVMIAIGAIGYVTNMLVFEPLQRRKTEHVHMLLASIGLLVIFPQVGGLIWGVEPLSYPHLLSKTLKFGNITLSGLHLIIIILSAILMIALQLFLRFTRYGQAMRAIADDRMMSELVGINIRSFTSLVFFIGCALGGVAGVMFGSIYYTAYDIGIIGISAFAAAVLGGLGNITGAMIGGIILGLIEAVGGTMVSSRYVEILTWGVLVVVLLLRPQGIFAKKQRSDLA